MISDEEFDLLKAELQWAGSSKATANRKQTKNIAEMQACLKGNPILSEEEFDTLKHELKDINGKQMMSDEEFDLLKAELQWAGSSKATVNRKETKHIAEMQACLKGNPILNEEEFDACSCDANLFEIK